MSNDRSKFDKSSLLAVRRRCRSWFYCRWRDFSRTHDAESLCIEDSPSTMEGKLVQRRFNRVIRLRPLVVTPLIKYLVTQSGHAIKQNSHEPFDSTFKRLESRLNQIHLRSTTVRPDFSDKSGERFFTLRSALKGNAYLRRKLSRSQLIANHVTESFFKPWLQMFSRWKSTGTSIKVIFVLPGVRESRSCFWKILDADEMSPKY